MISTGALALFGQPRVLPGEDVAAYNGLFTRLRAAVKPTDFIYEIYIDDVVTAEWDILRFQRLKLSLLRPCELGALRSFVDANLGYRRYADYFVEGLTNALQDELTEDQADFARLLARRCGRNDSAALEEVEKILPRTIEERVEDTSEFMLLPLNTVIRENTPNMDSIRSAARWQKAGEIVEDYARGKADAVKFIRTLLVRAGKSIDDLMTESFMKKLPQLEQIDDRIAVAESRRNAALREIDRRNALLGERLRSSVQQIEDAEFEVIETRAAKGKNGA